MECTIRTAPHDAVTITHSYMKKYIIISASFVIVLLIIIGLSAIQKTRCEGAFFAMGGIPVRVVAYDRTRAEFGEDLRSVENQVERLENIFSRYRSDSDISRLNRAGRSCLNVSEHLIKILQRSKHWADITGGAFDVTVGPLIDMWKRAEREGRLPVVLDNQMTKSNVGMGLLRIEGDRVCLSRDDMSLDLGGIAKGAILDAAVDTLVERGVHRGVVDAGGDVAAFGDGEFGIGIRDPLNKDELMGILKVPAVGVVTSGNYERFVTIGGKRYSHIIDPRIGMPVESLISVTVFGPNATDADALATAISVMGREQAIGLLQSLENFRVIMIERNDRGKYDVWCSADLAELIELAPPWKGALRTF